MIDTVLTLIGVLGLGSLYLLFQRIKSAILTADVRQKTTEQQVLDTKINTQDQTIEELTKKVQEDLDAFNKLKNTPSGSDSTH